MIYLLTKAIKRKNNRLAIFANIPPIYTPRIFMRRIVPQDAEDMFEYSSDPNVTQYLSWNPHTDIEFTKKYLNDLQKYYHDLHFYDWALVERETGKMFGTCGYTSIDLNENTAQVGYVLNRGYWGRGFATEAVSAAIVFGFERMKFDSIYARYMVENEASRRVMDKCRMKYEGESDEYIEAKGETRRIAVCRIYRPKNADNSETMERIF